MRYLFLALFLSACTTAPTPAEVRRQDVRACAKDLKQSDFDDGVSRDFCLEVYGFKKVPTAIPVKN